MRRFSDKIGRMKIGQKIVKLRTELGLNQRQLAEALGVSAASLNEWESDKIFPSKRNLEKLQNFFRVTFVDEKLYLSKKDNEIMDLLLKSDEATKDIILAILKR